MAQNPATPSGVIGASVPPANMISASPRAMMRAESPTACDPLAQAVTEAEFGPFAP